MPFWAMSCAVWLNWPFLKKAKPMEAIILAGGFGTRLRQKVSDVPKPMAPINGRPFLEILLSSLAMKGFQRVVMSLGFMAEKISGHFGQSFTGLEINYVVEDKPLGTGGGIRLAMDLIENDHVFVFNGDTFLDLEVNEVNKKWFMDRRPLIIGRHVENTARYGRLLVSNGAVVGFSEKGIQGGGLINGGCYVLRRDQLDGYPLLKPFSFEADYLVDAVLEKKFDVFVTQGQFIDIGVPEDYLRAQSELKIL